MKNIPVDSQKSYSVSPFKYIIGADNILTSNDLGNRTVKDLPKIPSYLPKYSNFNTLQKVDASPKSFLKPINTRELNNNPVVFDKGEYLFPKDLQNKMITEKPFRLNSVPVKNNYTVNTKAGFGMQSLWKAETTSSERGGFSTRNSRH